MLYSGARGRGQETWWAAVRAPAFPVSETGVSGKCGEQNVTLI